MSTKRAMTNGKENTHFYFVDFGYCLVFNECMDKYTIYKYEDVNGNNCIEDFIRKSTKIQRGKIIRLIEYLQIYGITHNNPSLKKMSGINIWEMRSLGKDNIRIFCAPYLNGIVLLHIVIKKTQKTSKGDLFIIQKRLEELLD